jgi:hypothetical protein
MTHADPAGKRLSPEEILEVLEFAHRPAHFELFVLQHGHAR